MRKPLPFGKYLLLDRIAIGGMAEVFVAKAFGVAGFERILAIKKILPTMVEDQEFIAMFVDEARIAVQLAHANIVQIHELGKHEESLYIAMEYVSGKDLRAILDRYKKKGGVLPVSAACFIGARICEALDYAHRKRGPDGRPLSIIHRDVSPQNVLVSFEGEVKLCDFGIAKAADRSQKTQAGILKGKFGYMSPEQVRGLPIDRRSDIFAAGALIFEMLTGEKLFHGESDFSTLEKVRKAEVPSLASLNASVPDALEKVVRRALAREPDDRYGWASDMHDDLLRFTVSGDTVFTAKHLAAFIRENFGDDLGKEEERSQRWAQTPMPKTAPPPPAPMALSTPGGGLRVEPFAEPPAPPPIPESVLREAARAEGALAAGIQAPANRALPSDPSQMSTEQFRIAEDKDTLATPSHPVRSPLLDEAASSPNAPTPVDFNAAPPDATTPETPLPTAAADLQPPGGTGRTNILDDVLPKRGTGRTNVLPEDAISDMPTGPQDQPREPPPKVRHTVMETPAMPRRAAVEVEPDEDTDWGAPRKRGRFWKMAGVAFASLAAAALVIATVVFVFQALDEPETAILIISAQPSNAELTLDGHPAMLPFIDRKIAIGKHTVIVRASGHKEYAEEVFLEGGQSRTVSVELHSLDEAPPVHAAEEEVAEEEEEATDEKGEDEEARPAPRERPRPPAERTAARAPEPVREEPPAEEGSGSMMIFSSPQGAAITLNGKPMGTTPATLSQLPIRNYKVGIHLLGYEPQEVEVRLRPDQTVPVRVKLQALGGGAGPPARSEVREPPPVPPPSVPPPAPTARGTLICSTRPVAKVFVDGRDTGRWTPIAPNAPLEISAGRHRLTFVTESGRRHEMEVTIEGGKTSRLVGINIP